MLPTPKQLNDNDRDPVLETIRTIKGAVESNDRRLAQTTSFANENGINIISGIGDIYDDSGTDPFTGTAMVYPPYIDANGDEWHFIGVNAGVLQFGLSAANGKAYAGAGAITIGSDGIKITTSGSKESGRGVNFLGENYVTSGEVASVYGTEAGGARVQASLYVDAGASSNSELTNINLRAYAPSASGAGEGGQIVMSVGDTAGSLKTIHYFTSSDGNATFTPVITGTTVGGVGTYTGQAGNYYRIGNLVYFTISLGWTAHTGTGNMTITGLPFTTASGSDTSVFSPSWSNITLAAAGNKILAYALFSSTTITLREVGSGANSALPMDTSGALQISGTYIAA